MFFFNSASFVKAVTLHKNDMLKRKKKEDTAIFDQSTYEKVLNLIGYTGVEKREEIKFFRKLNFEGNAK